MSPETFERLVPAFPHLDSLVLNGIGEPLLHPHLETFIARARSLLPEGASVGFQSNGMALTDERAASLVDAGLDRICISLDTVSDDSFRSIRSGGEMQGIVVAFASLNKAKARRRGRDLRIGIEFVLMRNNLADLPEAIRWAGRSGASFAIVTQLLPYQKDTRSAGGLRYQHHWLPSPSTSAGKQRHCRKAWTSGGISIPLTKVGRTPEEERIVQLVGADEKRRRGAGHHPAPGAAAQEG